MARETINLDFDWKFKRGDDLAGFSTALDDSDWREVNIPHDFSIEGPFREDNPSGPRGGYAPAGVAWYRKWIFIPLEMQDKKTILNFDGIYMNSMVFVNEECVGIRPYGYSGLWYDVTEHLVPGEKNLISVRVDNSLQPGSRWYSGSGIYRHARLIVTGSLRIDRWGVYVTTPRISRESASVQVRVKVRNDHHTAVPFILKNTILNPEGTSILESSSRHSLQSGASGEYPVDLEVPDPELWDIETPCLYTLKTELVIEGDFPPASAALTVTSVAASDRTEFVPGTITDSRLTAFGIREIRFDAEKGFSLNGKSVKLKGVCLHHDNGCLGAAGTPRAKERQICILKEMGVNAIRTSHNPPSPVLLDLCDRYGMLVMDEAFDEWREGKRPRVFDDAKRTRKPIYAYARYFDAWAEEDLRTMVMRDRNHPCVILWSIGNEIHEHGTPEGREIAERLSRIVRESDRTRPVTSAMVNMAGANIWGIPDLLDVAGYNYHESLYNENHNRYPGRVILGSENSTAQPFEPRGCYTSFLESAPHVPSFNAMETAAGDMTSMNAAGRYVRGEHSWKLTREYGYCCGLFLWTGFDYIGEPTPYAWPSRSSYFGVIDLCGFPKDSFYFYKSRWTTEPMIHLLPHWTWPGKEGSVLPVWCFSNCDSVELFLNGRSLGERSFSDTDYLHLAWNVVYEPGELKAVGKISGKAVLTETVETAGHPAGLRILPDRAEIAADGYDLSFVTVEVIDSAGRVVPTADTQILFTVTGNGVLAGVDNGDPAGNHEYSGSSVRALTGRCLAVVKAGRGTGEITITARAEGHAEVKAVIKLRSRT